MVEKAKITEEVNRICKCKWPIMHASMKRIYSTILPCFNANIVLYCRKFCIICNWCFLQKLKPSMQLISFTFFTLLSCTTIMPATCVQNTRIHLFSYSCAYISIPLTTTNAALFNLCIFMKSYYFFNTGAAVFSDRLYQVWQCNNGSQYCCGLSNQPFTRHVDFSWF